MMTKIDLEDGRLKKETLKCGHTQEDHEAFSHLTPCDQEVMQHLCGCECDE